MVHEPALSEGAKAALAVLARAPGPSPWYCEFPASRVTRQGRPLRWQAAGDKPPFSGKTFLMGPELDRFAVLDFHCYVLALPGDQFLVWWAGKQRDVGADAPMLHIELYSAQSLQPLDADRLVALLSDERLFAAGGAPMAQVSLTTAMTDGDHRVEVPQAMRAAGSLVFVLDSTAEGRRSNGWDQIHRRLWVLDCARGFLRVIPQDWYNEGPYDVGYQWITRAALDPATQRLVVEGIRLGVARLDASGRQVDAWLHEYMFYQPDVSRG